MKKNIIKSKEVEELEARLENIKMQSELENHLSNYCRGRSITVGTVFGGTSEIMIRGDGNRFMYVIMQPVEILEFINQLAANVGCHIAIKPRDDFGSWREWRISEAEKKHLNNHVPFVNDMAVFQQLGASGFNQKLSEQVMDEWLQAKEYEYSYDNKETYDQLEQTSNTKSQSSIVKSKIKNKVNLKQ